MATIPSHIAALPEGLLPAKSSTQLLNDHIDTFDARGKLQKVVSLSFDFGSNYISMLKKGELIPMTRIIALANALKLDDQDRAELLNTRLMEMHGQKGVICMETITAWALDTFKPRELHGDTGRLLSMWEEATAPAPHLLNDLLADPIRASAIRDAMHKVVQSELADIANSP